MYRPGGFRITDRAIQVANIPVGGRILEIGCGEGETAERLERKYGYSVLALDQCKEMVAIASKRLSHGEVRLGDGEFLDGIESNSFDGVIMECVLGLIGMPEEALHEAFCVLKKGGKLIVSDISLRVADPTVVDEARRAAEDWIETAFEDGDLDRRKPVVSFKWEEKFIVEELGKVMLETGFKNVYVQDFTDELESYVIEKILEGSPVECRVKAKKNTGYFLMIGEK